jgi:hypothetical protein
MFLDPGNGSIFCCSTITIYREKMVNTNLFDTIFIGAGKEKLLLFPMLAHNTVFN